MWEKVPLPEVLDFREGPGIMARDFRDEGVPLIRLAGLKGRSVVEGCNFLAEDDVERRWSQFRTRLGDTLLSTSASLGEVAVVDSAGVGAVPYTGIITFRPKDDRVAPGFIPLMLREQSFKDQIEAMGVGSVMKHFGPTHLKHMNVTVPPRREQHAITEVLGALDDKIAANICASTRADELITTEFDRAMMDGARSTPLLEEITIEFGEPFGGKFFSAPGCGRPLIRIRDLKSFDSQVWTTESRSRETAIDAGDVLVGMDAEFRATTWLGERGVLNQRVLRASHERYGNALVREVLRLPLSEIENEKSATTVIHLNKSDLARKSVVMPVETAMLKFERLAEPLYEARVALAKENRTLAATRDALLPQLMSGKLRVRDAETIAADAGA
jgi:type I restriction enzyme S subunit